MSINWEAVHVCATILLALVGLLNFWVAAKIDKRIAQVKTWAFKIFLTKHEAELLIGKPIRPNRIGDFSALDGG